MLDQMTSTAYTRWSPGMRKTLLLYKKTATSLVDTADPYGTALTYSACRKRVITTQLMLVYGPVIGVSKAQLFEMWNPEAHVASEHPANGDVLQESDGTRWTIKKADEIILGKCFLCICIPEI